SETNLRYKPSCRDYQDTPARRDRSPDDLECGRRLSAAAFGGQVCPRAQSVRRLWSGRAGVDHPPERLCAWRTRIWGNWRVIGGFSVSSRRDHRRNMPLKTNMM